VAKAKNLTVTRKN